MKIGGISNVGNGVAVSLANKPTLPSPPLETSLTIIDTFQSGHGWSATTADGSTNLNNTNNPVISTQYASLVTQGIGTGTPARLTKTGLNIDLTNKQIRLLVRVNNSSALNNLQFFAGPSGFSSYYLWQLARYSSTVTAFTKENTWGWITFSFEGASISGSPSKNTITDLRITAIDDGSAKVTVDIAAIAIAPDPTSLTWPQGVISFTCDDGWATQISNAKPILDRYLYPATTFPIVDTVMGQASLGSEGSINFSQLQQLHSVNGWEVGVHAYKLANHNAGFSTLSSSDLDTEMQSAKQWIRDNNLGTGDNLAYPLGDYNDIVIGEARKYFTSARSIHDFYKGETFPPADTHKLRVLQLNSGVSLATAKTAVDACLANGTWLIFTFHRIDTVADSKTWIISDFSSLVDYIATKRIPVRTLGAVLNTDRIEGARFSQPKTIVTSFPTVSPGIVNTTTETAIASLIIPASQIKAKDLLEIDIAWDFLNNSGSAVTYIYRLKIGATTVGTTGSLSIGASASRGGARGKFYIALPQLNTPRVWGEFMASFAGSGFTGQNTSHSGILFPNEPSVDFSTDTTVQLTCAMGTAAATADFRSHIATVKRIPSAF